MTLSALDRMQKKCNKEDGLCPDNIDAETCESIYCEDCHIISETLKEMDEE
jgi:hypothetical protein